MKNKKIILVLALVCLAGICYAQEKKGPPPLNFKDTIITHVFTAPVLRLDKGFIVNLNALLFESSNWVSSLLSNPKTTDRNIHFVFLKKKDSLNYSVQVELNENPGIGSIGFFEHNGFLYWFYSNTPPGIILRTTKSKRQFLYKEYKDYSAFREYRDRGDNDRPEIAEIYDPTIWFLTYNRQTGKIGWLYE